MCRDPIVAEVHRIREEYAAKFNYDLDAIFRDLCEKERKRGGDLVRLPPKPPTPRAAKAKPVKRAKQGARSKARGSLKKREK